MLTIYVDSDVNYECLNDLFFDENTYKNVMSSSELRKIIESVENVSFVSGTQFKSKFNNTILDISDISTGTKTLMNVICYPDKIFLFDECGLNIIDELFKLSDGLIWGSCVPLPTCDFKSCRVVYKDNSFICNSLDDLQEVYNKYVRDSVSD